MELYIFLISICYFIVITTSHISHESLKNVDIVENEIIVPAQPVLPTGNKICLDRHIGKLYRALQEWYDDSCHKYQCEIRNGRYTVAVVGCIKPVPPPNAIECHEHVSEKTKARYPFCCTRLRCIIKSNGQKYIQVSGQPGEFIPNKLYKDCSEGHQSMDESNDKIDTNKFPEQSAELNSAKFRDAGTDEDVDKPIFEDETPLRKSFTAEKDILGPEYTQPEKYRTLLDWLLWPIEVLILSEAEVLRIVDSIDESMYRYWRSPWPTKQ